MSIFYKSLRVGKNGKYFYLLKFRTMKSDGGSPTAGGNDPRLTKFGRWMRKWKIDELPTLINLIKGDIVLAGPRAEVPEVVVLMTQEERDIILSVKPGIVDRATLWDFHEDEMLKDSVDPHADYLKFIWPEKKRLQIEYVKNKSLWEDIKIITLCFLKILRIK